MYASVNASRRSIDYGALLRASHTPAAAGSGRGSIALPLPPPPPPCISEMRQVTELLLLADDDAVDNHLSWLLSASPLAAGLSGEADEDDDDGGEMMITDDDSTTAKWRRLVRAGLPPSTPVCSIHCTDPLLILRTLAHWCVPWRATPAPFLDLLFIVRAQNVSAPLSSALCGGELTDLCVRDAAERVVHARANWNATMAAMARTDQFLRFSHDIDPIDINRPSSGFKSELFCPISRILRTTALYRLHAALVVATDDARHAHGLLAQDSIDLLEYLLVQHSAPRPVRVDPPACLKRQVGLNYASKVEDDDREAEECGWFQPGGLRSARLLAWLLCSSTVSETHKFGDARPFGLLDGNGAPPEIVQWCSDLLVPRFRAMHEDAPKDEKHWILEVARMRCARSVLVRAALNIGAADLALSCAAAGGCGGRVPRTSTVRLPVYERIMWNWRDQTVEPCRIALPRDLMMSGWDFFVRGASAEHFGEKLLYRLLRAAVKHPAQQPTWFMRAILLYPATLELVLHTLLLRPPTTQSSSSDQIWAIEEDLDGSLSLPRDADQDAEMAKRVAARVLQSFVDAPEACARGQVLVLLRSFLMYHQPFPEAFWRTHISQVLRATRSADTELLQALAALAESTGSMAEFRAAAVFGCRRADHDDRDTALAKVLVWPAAGTDEVVDVADTRWLADAHLGINIFLQAIQRARRLGCPWGPEAGWYASDEEARMQQLEELNAWIVSEQRAANAIFSTFPDSGK